MPKRFLNFEYNGVQTRINVAEMNHLDAARTALKQELTHMLAGIEAVDLQFYTNRKMDFLINDWDTVEALPRVYFINRGSSVFIYSPGMEVAAEEVLMEGDVQSKASGSNSGSIDHGKVHKKVKSKKRKTNPTYFNFDIDAFRYGTLIGSGSTGQVIRLKDADIVAKQCDSYNNPFGFEMLQNEVAIYEKLSRLRVIFQNTMEYVTSMASIFLDWNTFLECIANGEETAD